MKKYDFKTALYCIYFRINTVNEPSTHEERQNLARTWLQQNPNLTNIDKDYAHEVSKKYSIHGVSSCLVATSIIIQELLFKKLSVVNGKKKIYL